MLDFFPGRTTKFHFTFGVFGGPGKLLTVDGTSSALAEEDKGTAGFVIGNTIVTTDENGYCHADIAPINNIMPYFGIGTGRAASPNKAVSFVFDLGACYSKGIGAYTYGINSLNAQKEYILVTSEGIDNRDGGVLDILGSFPVLPVMKFSLFFKLF